jgi:hypothetical protein
VAGGSGGAIKASKMSVTPAILRRHESRKSGLWFECGF